MRLEYISEGSPDCPLIRICDFSANECQKFIEICLDLAARRCSEVDLNAAFPINHDWNCTLILKVKNRNYGAQLGASPSSFEWAASADQWQNIAGLLEPLVSNETRGYQWLDRSGAIAILMSRTGRW